MILPIELKVKQILVDQLYKVYNFEEVLGYCSQCNNFKNNYSCPDLPFNPKEYLKDYKYVTLILTEIDTKQIQSHIDKFGEKDLISRVQQLHMPKGEDSHYNVADAIAMKCFENVKNLMADELLELEVLSDGSISSPPGSCTRCTQCTKAMGEACVFPDKLRYSLEALGFLISDLYTEFFGIELDWSKGELPKAYHTCSALFHNKDLDSKIIVKQVSNATKNVTI